MVVAYIEMLPNYYRYISDKIMGHVCIAITWATYVHILASYNYVTIYLNCTLVHNKENT